MRPTKRKRSNNDALRRAERKSPRRRRRVPILAALLVVLVGACMIGYPFASDYLNKLEQAKVTQDLAHTIEETPEEDLSAYMQQAIDYNERLLSGSTYVVDPFDPDAPTATDEDYANCLNLNGDGVMGQIVIPKIGVNLPISHGTEGSGMDHGVGHVTNTSLPVGGESTHSVLAGHTGLPSAVIFDKLDQLEVGDYLIIQVLGEDHAYRVTSTEVVLPDDTSSLGVKQGEDLVTLVTCTPYGVNSHRLLVHAERCEVPQDWLERKASGDTALPFPYETGSQSFPPFLVGVLVALATILSYAVFKHVRRRLTPTGRHGRRRGFR
jgi:sortase A